MDIPLLLEPVITILSMRFKINVHADPTILVRLCGAIEGRGAVETVKWRWRRERALW